MTHLVFKISLSLAVLLALAVFAPRQSQAYE